MLTSLLLIITLHFTFLNYQIVSKHYEDDFLQSFLLFYTCLLTVLVVKKLCF